MEFPKTIVPIDLHIIPANLEIENGAIKILRMNIVFLVGRTENILLKRKAGQPNFWVTTKSKAEAVNFEDKNTKYLYDTFLNSEFEFSNDFGTLIVRSLTLHRELYLKKLNRSSFSAPANGKQGRN